MWRLLATQQEKDNPIAKDLNRCFSKKGINWAMKRRSMLVIRKCKSVRYHFVPTRMRLQPKRLTIPRMWSN